MHPMFELLLNPTAGAAGFNLISVVFYSAIMVCIFLALLENCVVNRSRRGR